MIRLGDYIEIRNGYAFKSDNYVEDGIRVIRITNVQKGNIVDDNPKYYHFDTKKDLSNYLISENDILVSLTGNVGRVGKFPANLLPAYLNQRVCKINVVKKEIDADYLYHILNSDNFERDAVNNSAGAAQLNLSTKWIEEYKIPLPTIAVQQKIAVILDAADELRKKDKALVAKYDELTQALFLDMFGDPVTNPKGWEKKILESVCTEIIDCPHSTPKYINDSSEFPCIRTTELKNGDIDWSKMKYLDKNGYLERVKRLIPEEGDIVYGREGTFGEAIIIPANIKMSLGQRVMLFRPNNKLVTSRFLHSIVRSQSVYNQALKANTGSTVGHVNVKDVKKFILIIPPIKLQYQFAERVKAIEEQKNIAQASALKSEELFNSLLQKAFNEELV